MEELERQKGGPEMQKVGRTLWDSFFGTRGAFTKYRRLLSIQAEKMSKGMNIHNDVIVDTVIQKALEHADQFSVPPGKGIDDTKQLYFAWLCTILRNTNATQHRRDFARHQLEQAHQMSLYTAPPSPEDAVITSQENDAVIERLHRWPELIQALLQLTEGNALPDIARRLKMSEKDLRSRLQQEGSMESLQNIAAGSREVDMFVTVADLEKLRPHLTEKRFQIYRMRFAEQMSLEDIAHTLKIPIGTVKSGLSRARKEMAKLKEVNLEPRETFLDKFRTMAKLEPRKIRRILAKRTGVGCEILKLLLSNPDISLAEIQSRTGLNSSKISGALSRLLRVQARRGY